MRNKYPGICYRCHKPVAKGEGHFERHAGGWRTQHADCCTKAKEECMEEEQRQLGVLDKAKANLARRTN